MAPDYEEGALAILKKKKNLRIIKIATMEGLTDIGPSGLSISNPSSMGGSSSSSPRSTISSARGL